MAEEIKKYDMTLSASEIDAALLVAKNSVSYEPQTPTEAQQAQARANLGLGDGVCLPVVELESVIENGVALSKADSVKLDEAVAIGKPVVISCSINIGGGLFQGMFVFNAATTTIDENRTDLFQTRLLDFDVALAKLQGETSWGCDVT